MTIDDISDWALLGFVLWARENRSTTVTNPDVARRVLNAYAQTAARVPA